MNRRSGHAALRRGRHSAPHGAYHVSAATFQRTPLFTDFDATCAACRCFGDRALLGQARLLAWVLMPDHAHWLVQLGPAGTLPGVVNRLKSASARAVNRVLGRGGRVWARAYFDRALRAEDDLADAARYLVGNPVRAGLVRRAGDYPFWDAVWL